MTPEDQLTRLFRDDAERVEVGDGREAILRRVRHRRRRRRARRAGLAALIAAAVAAVVVIVSGGRGPGGQVVNVAGTGGGTLAVQQVRSGSIGLKGSAASISCVSSRWCVAVGTYNPTSGPNGPAPQVDAYRGVHALYSGSGWRSMPAGDTANLPGGLSGISCVSTDWCTAVGSTSPTTGPERTLIETWNGQRWNRMPSPSTPGNDYLSAVSCASRHFCVAVGYTTPPGGATNQALAESFDGNRWTLRPPPVIAPGTDHLLTAVSCPASGWCLAVGGYRPKTASPVADRYSNGRWTVITVPGHHKSGLSSVVCVNRARCSAVGSDSAAAVVEDYLQGTWTAQSVTVPPHGSLAALGCSTQDCVAVGSTTPHGARYQRPVVAVLGAGTPTVATTGQNINEMTSISCPRPRTCIAVGNDHDSLAGIYLLITIGPS